MTMNPDSILNLIMTPSKDSGSKSRSQNLSSNSLSVTGDTSPSQDYAKAAGKVKKKNSFRKKLTQRLAAVTGSQSINNNNNSETSASRVKKSSSCIASIMSSSNGEVVSSESDEDLRCYDFSGGDERQPLEGQLYKYTNVVKGWQFRWFVLDPDAGRLDYYEKEEYRRQKPRGYLHLAGAVISPSDEDSQTFTVNAANAEIFRLRALDAKERQHWVNRLRATSEYHTDLLLKENRTEYRIGHGSCYGGSLDSLNKSSDNIRNLKVSYRKLPTNSHKSQPLPQSANTSRRVNSPVVIKKRSHRKSLTGSHQNISDTQFKEVKEMLTQASHQAHTLNYKIEDLPASGEATPFAVDRDLLLMKATSAATLSCLENCLSILQQQNIPSQQPYPSALHHHHCLMNGVGSELAIRSPAHYIKAKSSSISPAESFSSVASHLAVEPPNGEMLRIRPEDEVEDPNTYQDTDLEGVEEHKSIILHLLSQLKLGMDLTKVVLPTFILEKRSLLEMFADCMAHPDLFVSITEQQDAQARMMAVVEWYLTSFHAGRQGCLAKKPYNPIIGETFHCSWKLPSTKNSSGPSQTRLKPECSNSSCAKSTEETSSQLINGLDAAGSESMINGHDTTPTKQEEEHKENTTTESVGSRLFFTGEQVSHHPPISAFYFECPERKMAMNASIWTKSKFLGMSIGVSMIGKIQLYLRGHDNEMYDFSLPSAYARSILTLPWVELGDKININCPKTGYSAAVIFHTKPFYGGRLHKTTAEVKNPAGDVICKVLGEWNGALQFTYANGDTKTIETSSLSAHHKCVRPLSLQGEFESRKLWRNVTESLQRGDVDAATEHKRFLEERQRQGEKIRKENSTPFPTRFFHKQGDRWIFNSLAKSSY